MQNIVLWLHARKAKFDFNSDSQMTANQWKSSWRDANESPPYWRIPGWSIRPNRLNLLIYGVRKNFNLFNGAKKWSVRVINWNWIFGISTINSWVICENAKRRVIYYGDVRSQFIKTEVGEFLFFMLAVAGALDVLTDGYREGLVTSLWIIAELFWSIYGSTCCCRLDLN